MAFEKYYTLAEIKQARQMFFENRQGPEKYHIRKNHLIIERLDTGKVVVWQFHHVAYHYRLTPVWYAPAGAGLAWVLHRVEDMLSSGTLPVHPHNGYNHSAAIKIRETEEILLDSMLNQEYSQFEESVAVTAFHTAEDYGDK